MATTRWIFTNPATSETWTVPLNPNTMTTLFAPKKITSQTTTAVNGQVLLFQGNTTPQDWSFGGDILDAAHYEKLRHWVYDIHQRIEITDHFGRRITCVLTHFDPTPKRAVGRYWRHTYTVRAIVISVGMPTVGV